MITSFFLTNFLTFHYLTQLRENGDGMVIGGKDLFPSRWEISHYCYRFGTDDLVLSLLLEHRFSIQFQKLYPREKILLFDSGYDFRLSVWNRISRWYRKIFKWIYRGMIGKDRNCANNYVLPSDVVNRPSLLFIIHSGMKRSFEECFSK